MIACFFFSSRRRHTRCGRDWSSDVCSSDLGLALLHRVDTCRQQRTGLIGGLTCLCQRHVWIDTERHQLLLRSEEHTSELQSRPHLVCRLLLEKKKKNIKHKLTTIILTSQ